MNKHEKMERTFCCLEKCHKKMFEKFGWMLLVNNKKRLCYMKALIFLKDCLEFKLQKIESNDAKQDLVIMWKNINTLIDFAQTIMA
jgi:hypothetical protein